jgi:hypothetical protein
MWYVAWIRNNKDGERRWSFQLLRRDRYRDIPGGRGSQEVVRAYDAHPTRAAALKRCKELAAKETDPRYSYMPFSQWKFDAQSLTCGIRPWTTRADDLASIEISRKLDAGEIDHFKGGH